MPPDRPLAPQLLSELYDEARLARGEVDPQRVALTDGTNRLTWFETIDRVGRLATSLIDTGVSPGDRVGVLMPKSIGSFVAVHAIHRAGGVMVPLDALAPPAYTAGVIADAGVDVVIADRRSAATCIDAGVRAVLLPGVSLDDAGRAPFADVVVRDEADIDGAATGQRTDRAHDDPAYIIYTSGSTGTPKGIVHTNASALAYAAAAADEYGLDAEDRFANIAPLHFDQSTFELYTAPLVGGTVIVVPDPVLRFPASVSELVEQERATVWYSVPYLLEQIAARGALDERDLGSLRWILFGGEAFVPSVLASLMSRLPSARWSNVYGPAEVNQCTAFEVTQAATEPVPIGRAWPAATVRIVNADAPRTLATVGEGMLAVATDTMMTGYWGRPDLTERSIVIDGDGTRWYLTGDRARQADDGTLHFLGRMDHQVKVRGHRIELEAIDAVLREVGGVAEATVVVDRSGDEPRLVALLVAADGAVERSDDLAVLAAEAARTNLPRYAVPAAFQLVTALPRTASRKVDRGAAAALLIEE